MKDTQKSRDAQVKVVVELENCEAVTLLDGRRVWPFELRLTFRNGVSGPHWTLIAHQAKADGSLGKRAVEVSTYDFCEPYAPFRRDSADLTPDWLPELLVKYAPADIDNT